MQHHTLQPRRAEREKSPGPSQLSRSCPARYVLLQLATALTGYTVKAMQRKIERGDWAEGRVWRHAPDGRIVIDLVGYPRFGTGFDTGSRGRLARCRGFRLEEILAIDNLATGPLYSVARAHGCHHRS